MSRQTRVAMLKRFGGYKTRVLIATRRPVGQAPVGAAPVCNQRTGARAGCPGRHHNGCGSGATTPVGSPRGAAQARGARKERQGKERVGLTPVRAGARRRPACRRPSAAGKRSPIYEPETVLNPPSGCCDRAGERGRGAGLQGHQPLIQHVAPSSILTQPSPATCPGARPLQGRAIDTRYRPQLATSAAGARHASKAEPTHDRRPYRPGGPRARSAPQASEPGLQTHQPGARNAAIANTARPRRASRPPQQRTPIGRA